MTATNHVLTGAAIGLIVGQAIALPLALASHYILDMIPHFNPAGPSSQFMQTNKYRNYLLSDAGLCLLLGLGLLIFRPDHWLLALACSVLAAAPDATHLREFSCAQQGRKWRANLYDRLTINIQWFQKPIGIWVEIAWFIALIILIAPFIVH